MNEPGAVKGHPVVTLFARNFDAFRVIKIEKEGEKADPVIQIRLPDFLIHAFMGEKCLKHGRRDGFSGDGFLGGADDVCHGLAGKNPENVAFISVPDQPAELQGFARIGILREGRINFILIVAADGSQNHVLIFGGKR